MFTNIKLLIKADRLYNSLKKNDMKQIGAVLAKNWKTTAAGIIMVVVGVLTHNGVLTADQGTLVGSILGGLGLLASKDGNVTGNGTTNP